LCEPFWVSIAWVGAITGLLGRPEGLAPGLAQEPPGVNVRIETFPLRSEVFGNRRTIRVLLPRGYSDAANRERKYPVLYLNDGFALFKPGAWNAPEIVSRLESEGRIQPFILVGIDNGATAENGRADQRTLEYLPYADARNEPSVPAPRGSDYPEFLTREVMPAVAARYRVLAGPDGVGLGGASYGGLAAVYTVMNRPGVAGRLLVESTPLFLAGYAALEQARRTVRWPPRISIGIGTKETEDAALARTAGRDMEALRSAIRRGCPGCAVRLVIEPDATHGSEAWRRRLPAALEFLFPPRLP
jgi:predicted alpha/beta superfamily hydrolase